MVIYIMYGCFTPYNYVGDSIVRIFLYRLTQIWTLV